VRLAWLTDIHLDWLEADARRDVAADVSLTDADGVVVTGDITIATLLCGHSHGAGTAHILPNLTCRTGGAEYGEPVVQDVLDTAALP
jgi:hypothetical protein